jgi:hypothetical protein
MERQCGTRDRGSSNRQRRSIQQWSRECRMRRKVGPLSPWTVLGLRSARVLVQTLLNPADVLCRSGSQRKSPGLVQSDDRGFYLWVTVACWRTEILAS